ncbi:MBOAT family O-acyltransferase [Kordia algicida OT-1]|uniref:Alginate O-acetyltransferase n=1 Tax=Kordia algicida OT-1 TaxID=391587 RepID=A9DRZ0_9FLAO|nr:MBOAT family O-acyltransferase [Kordia algicida]EDP96862.1 alginate O-acetyltransferase [Kordia algicida OT-1]
MIFSTSLFLVFFTIVFAVYWFVLGSIKDEDTKLKARIIFLLLASYYFYMSWNPIFILLILFSTVVDYIAGKKIHQSSSKKQKRLFLIISLVTNLGFLAYFKYVNFFLGTVNDVAGTNFFVDVILPVGISFYTFQSMCYTIDIYYGKMKPSKDFFEFSLYVTFFPQLVAGPIVRAIDFIPQLKVNQRFKDINFQLAANYFLLGLVKKVVIADNIAKFSDPLFANPDQYGTLSSWIGVMSYSIQIYCDFSGYSDMAIGVAALLGFRLMENFNMPYNATNITVFWRKWHISLSTWLRDYLFIPLGGSRVSKKIFYYRNLMLTMLLGGLWHGASWNFVVWGGLHGAALIIHKLYKTKYSDNFKFSKFGTSLYTVSAWVLTMIFVMVTWVFFRAQTFGDAAQVLQNMFTFQESINYRIPIAFIALFGITVIGHFFGTKYYKEVEENQGHMFSNPYLQGALFGLAIFLVLLFGSDDNQAFIYFQF